MLSAGYFVRAAGAVLFFAGTILAPPEPWNISGVRSAMAKASQSSSRPARSQAAPRSHPAPRPRAAPAPAPRRAAPPSRPAPPRVAPSRPAPRVSAPPPRRAPAPPPRVTTSRPVQHAPATAPRRTPAPPPRVTTPRPVQHAPATAPRRTPAPPPRVTTPRPVQHAPATAPRRTPAPPPRVNMTPRLPVAPPFVASPLGQRIAGRGPRTDANDPLRFTPTPNSPGGGLTGFTRSQGRQPHGGFDDPSRFPRSDISGRRTDITRWTGSGQGTVTKVGPAYEIKRDGSRGLYVGQAVTIVMRDARGHVWESTTMHHQQILVRPGDRVSALAADRTRQRYRRSIRATDSRRSACSLAGQGRWQKGRSHYRAAVG